MNPGKHTSEFWLIRALLIAGAVHDITMLFVQGGMAPPWALIVSGVAAVLYNRGRVLLKKDIGAADLPDLTRPTLPAQQA